MKLRIYRQGKSTILFYLYAISLIEQIVVVKLVIILQHLPLDLRRIHPSNEIFHGACYQKCGVTDCIRPHSNVAVLNKSNGFSQIFSHSETHHHN